MGQSKNVIFATVVAVLAMFISSSSVIAVEVGQAAPEFELDSTSGGKLKLSDLKGKNVLINFYVLDYSPT
jgi:AhpC/TSA family